MTQMTERVRGEGMGRCVGEMTAGQGPRDCFSRPGGGAAWGFIWLQSRPPRASASERLALHAQPISAVL